MDKALELQITTHPEYADLLKLISNGGLNKIIFTKTISYVDYTMVYKANVVMHSEAVELDTKDDCTLLPIPFFRMKGYRNAARLIINMARIYGLKFRYN